MKKAKVIFNWTQALFQLIQTVDLLDLYYEASDDLILALKENYLFFQVMNSRKLSLFVKSKIVHTMISDPKLVYLNNAFILLADRKQAHFFIKILKELRRRINLFRNVAYATVYSCIALTKLQLKKLSQKLTNKFKLKVVCINKIDESLIAGLKVKFQNTVIDSSFFEKLSAIKKQALQQIE